MIVRDLGDRLLLITQPDHARLARALMEPCRQLRGRPRREDVLVALAEHDAAWDEVDAAPSVDPAGAVVDFIRAPLAVRQGVWPRSIARLADRPWAAALVAQHALIAYQRFRGGAEWDPFFARLEQQRDELLAGCGGSLAELMDDYPFLRLGDLVSLAFCTGRPDELRYGDWTVSPQPGAAEDGSARVLVAPDPFAGGTVPLEVAARVVPRAALGSDAALRAAFQVAEVIVLRGSVAGTASAQPSQGA